MKGLWGNPGHGNYGIGSLGAVHSHSGANGVMSNGNLILGNGDVAEIEFNTRTMRLLISCKGKSTELNVEPPSLGDCYRLAVHMWSGGDDVELC